MAEEGEVAPDPSGPMAAFVCKTAADPFVGKLSYFRVCPRDLQSDSQAWNASRGEAERIGQLYEVRGKAQEAVAELVAGDIGAVSKLHVRVDREYAVREGLPGDTAAPGVPEPGLASGRCTPAPRPTSTR